MLAGSFVCGVNSVGEFLIADSQSNALPLDVVRTDSITETTIEGMVRPDDVAREL